MRGQRSHRMLATVAVVAVLASGCQRTGEADKTGADTVVLQLATIDQPDPNGQSPAAAVFITQLKSLSGGQLQVNVSTEYGAGAADAESSLVREIAAGHIDGGWPATRGFSRAGFTGLEPLEAPMVVTNVATQQQIVQGPVGAGVLKTLDGSGIVGLGLTVGPLRRPWSNTEPLTSPAAWKGVTARSVNSGVQDSTYVALGAVPVQASFHFPDLVAEGKLHAVETDVAQYAKNRYGMLLPFTARNVVLWPRMTALVLSQAAFDRLNPQQQDWVRQAAATAVQASVDYAYDEVTPALGLCKEGVRFVDATPAELAALREAVRPVVQEMAADPTNGPLLAQIQEIAAAHPKADVPAVPASCRRLP